MLLSPLRYPGGKAKLYSYFSKLIAHNGLFEKDYYEPYAGGAGLALRLLSEGYVRTIHLNDIDPAVYAFWRAAFFHNDEFCEAIQRTAVTIKEWHRQRDIWRSCDRSDYLSLGFATFFLNRTNRSGIIYGAGPIGGYAQEGSWKIDVRLLKDKQIANLRAMLRYSDAVSLYNEDAMTFVDRSFSRSDTLAYLDPPYYVKGRKLYTNYYKDIDHVNISDKLRNNRRSVWVVSYDDCPRIREIYGEFAPISYSLSYSAGEKSRGQEVIYLSDELTAPEVEGFERAA